MQKSLLPPAPRIIKKVAEYIQNSATYNLYYDHALDRSADIAIAFLSQYKEGICQHYATAATMLFRALGIPARFTVGYMASVTAGEAFCAAVPFVLAKRFG